MAAGSSGVRYGTHGSVPRKIPAPGGPGTAVLYARSVLNERFRVRTTRIGPVHGWGRPGSRNSPIFFILPRQAGGRPFLQKSGTGLVPLWVSQTQTQQHPPRLGHTQVTTTRV
mgnify:CR=1 FL=1